MNSRVAFPFLVLPDEAISFNGWMIGDPGQPLFPAGSILEHWDYARDLEVCAQVAINWKVASEALQLPIESIRLRLSLVVGTGTGSMPRRQYRLCEIVVDHSTWQSQLSGIVLGRTLSGRLHLSLMISMGEASADGTVLSPKIRGARLWHASHDILLEDGGESRFPVETASFSEIFKGRPQEHAPWFLHWRPSSMQSDFSACARLYINSDEPAVFARFVDGDEPTLQAVMSDVMSQMIGYALDQDDAIEALAECEEGSVGRQIRQWLDFSFPGQEIPSIKAMRDQNPGAFRAAILAASAVGSIEQ